MKDEAILGVYVVLTVTAVTVNVAVVNEASCRKHQIFFFLNRKPFSQPVKFILNNKNE